MKKAHNLTRRFEIRLSEAEFTGLLAMEREFGISRTDIFRQRVFRPGFKPVTDRPAILQRLDSVGAAVGRLGNNINQLARHANELRLLDKPALHVLDAFLPLFDSYISNQREIEKLLRQLLRSLKTRDVT
jgi:hypothetical protein